MRVMDLFLASVLLLSGTTGGFAEINQLAMRACMDDRASTNYRLAACSKLLTPALTPKERALVLTELAKLYAQQNDNAKAQADFDEAVGLWPDNAAIRDAQKAFQSLGDTL